MEMKRKLIGLCSVLICLFSSAFIAKPFDRISADQTPPTVTLSVSRATGENGWHNEPVFVRVNALDGGSGIKIAQVSLGGKKWYADAMRIAIDGEFMVIAQAIDRAGNKASVSQIVKIDLTPPELVVNLPEPRGENGYYIHEIPIEISGSDALSGVGDIGIRADGTKAFDGIKVNSTTAQITVDESGEYVVNGFVKDMAGNRIEMSSQLIADLVRPDAGIDTPMQFKGDIPLTGFADDNFSGVRSILVDFGSGWSTVDVNGTQWNTLWPASELEDGEYPIRVKVVDMAGNETMVTYDAPILNTLWPFLALFALLASISAIVVFDPRKPQLRILTAQIQRHNRMYQNSVRLGLEKEI